MKNILITIAVLFVLINNSFAQDDSIDTDDTMQIIEDTTNSNDDSAEIIESNMQNNAINDKEKITLSKRNIFDFAERLFSDGEYHNSSIEYLRFQYYFPGDTIIPYIEFKSAFCYERMNQMENARQGYGTLLKRLSSSPLKIDTQYRYFLTYYLENNYNELNTKISSFEKSNPDYPSYTLEYLRGWSYFKQAQFEETSDILKKQTQESNYLTPSINYLLSKTKQAEYIPHKSPFTAGVLSTFFPGSGQAYIGRWGDALYSLVFAVGGIGSSVALWEKDRTFAIISGSLGTFFYFGNIYGAIVSAKLFNRDNVQEFILKSENEIPHPPSDIMKGIKNE